MNNLEISVIGAGLAGLTSAIALAEKGNKVTLFEAAPVLGDVGAGITLAPNAMRGMEYIGVDSEISECGIEPTTQTIDHWQDARLILEVERSNTREKYGSAYVYIHRADLHSILTRAASNAGVQIVLGKELASIDCAGDKPVINFADGTTSSSASLVIGADGLKSQARKLFAPQPAYFTGHIAYRAIAKAAPEIQALINQPGMHIGPGKMVVRYPLRKGTLVNLVFFARQDGWTEDGWAIPAGVEELRSIYKGWNNEVQSLIGAIQTDTIFKWAINAHQPLKTWCIEDKVTLIGDSAHAMTPFLGQGAAMSIEDAIVFVRALDSAKTVSEGLQKYQNARLERTSYIQHESNLNADRLQGDEAELYGVKNLVNEETLGLFAYDCSSVPL